MAASSPSGPFPDVVLVLLLLRRVAELVVVEPPPDGLGRSSGTGCAREGGARRRGCSEPPRPPPKSCARVPPPGSTPGGGTRGPWRRLRANRGTPVARPWSGTRPRTGCRSGHGLPRPARSSEYARVEQRPEGVEPVRAYFLLDPAERRKALGGYAGVRLPPYLPTHRRNSRPKRAKSERSASRI